MLLKCQPRVVYSATMAFTFIFSHSATEYGTINTARNKFDRVLSCGPLWSDEGVYQISKDHQLFQEKKNCNIFLGTSGFHSEKNYHGVLWKIVRGDWNQHCVGQKQNI